MASVFDGLAGVLNAVFGAPVSITPPGSIPQRVNAVLRVGPIEVLTEDGRPVWFDAVTLQVQRCDAAIAVTDALVAAPNRPGETYRILSAHLTRSPAADAFVVCEMERVIP